MLRVKNQSPLTQTAYLGVVIGLVGSDTHGSLLARLDILDRILGRCRGEQTSLQFPRYSKNYEVARSRRQALLPHFLPTYHIFSSSSLDLSTHMENRAPEPSERSDSPSAA